MSADNYLYVGKRGGKYVIVDRSASGDYPARVMGTEQALGGEYDRAADAWRAASLLDFGGGYYTEYGVRMSVHVAAELAEPEDAA